METFDAQSDHVNATTTQTINIKIYSETRQRRTMGAKPAGRSSVNTVNIVNIVIEQSQ